MTKNISVHQKKAFLTTRLIALLLLLLFSTAASAAAIEISPMQLDLSKDQPITALNLSNRSPTPVVVQINSKRWMQQNTKDVYNDTRDIIITPPIITIPALGSHVVRIGLRRNVDINQELSYRIFIKEIPNYKERKPGVSVVLQISIPLFVAPESPLNHQLNWRATALKTQQLQLLLTNNSNQHIKINRITITPLGSSKPLIKENTFLYLLPTQNKKLLFAWAKSVKNIQINLVTDWGNIAESVTVAQN